MAACQTPEVHNTLSNFTDSGGNVYFAARRDFSHYWNNDGALVYNGIHTVLSGILPGIPGRYQGENAAVALAAAEILTDLGIPLPEESLKSGIRSAIWPGRMELLSENAPPILFDCAHNPAGAAVLAEALKDFSYRRLFMVAGIMADKDAAGIFSLLSNKVHRGYAVAPSVERALDAIALAGMLNNLGIQTTAYGSVASGIESAKRDAGDDDLILVCGSLFTVGEAKASLAGTRFKGIRG